jgi:tripartite-type tricarboxylate transporter receptor subunit TctC
VYKYNFNLGTKTTKERGKSMKLKSIITAGFLSAGILFAAPAWAEYPEKPITLVCWSSAGSGHDLMARMIAKVGEKYIGQPMVVLNKSGGSGKVAMSYVLNQKTDGYVVMTNTRSMTTSLRGASAGLSADDFKFVSRVVRDPFLITVAQDSPFNDIGDLVAYAKKNPGVLTVGGYETKSVDESLIQDLEAAAGIDLNYIPYKGGKEPVVAVLGGHIEVAIANPSEMMTNFKAGSLKVLALASDSRFAPFESVQTLSEQGYEVVTEHWRGVMAAGNVPDNVVATLNDMLAKVVVDPEFVTFMENANMYNGYMESEKFTGLVKKQSAM